MQIKIEKNMRFIKLSRRGREVAICRWDEGKNGKKESKKAAPVDLSKRKRECRSIGATCFYPIATKFGIQVDQVKIQVKLEDV